MGAHETRTFKSGNSVAVRLPAGLGIAAGEPVSIEREGDVLTVRRLKDPAAEKRKLRQWLATLAALPAPGELGARAPIDIPERPGA